MQTLQDYARDFAKYYSLDRKNDYKNVVKYFEDLGFEISHEGVWKMINEVKKLEKGDLKKITF